MPEAIRKCVESCRAYQFIIAAFQQKRKTNPYYGAVFTENLPRKPPILIAGMNRYFLKRTL